MRKMATLLLAGALGMGAGAGLAGRAFADDYEGGHEHQTITMGDLPAPVRATIEREAKGGKVEELKKETGKNGAVTYEAEVVKNGKGREIEVNDKGKVIERGKTHSESGEHENETEMK